MLLNRCLFAASGFLFETDFVNEDDLIIFLRPFLSISFDIFVLNLSNRINTMDMADPLTRKAMISQVELTKRPGTTKGPNPCFRLGFSENSNSFRLGFPENLR